MLRQAVRDAQKERRKEETYIKDFWQARGAEREALKLVERASGDKQHEGRNAVQVMHTAGPGSSAKAAKLVTEEAVLQSRLAQAELDLKLAATRAHVQGGTVEPGGRQASKGMRQPAATALGGFLRDSSETMSELRRRGSMGSTSGLSWLNM